MVVKALTQQVDTDAELIALTGMANNHFVYHNGLEQLYIYEANYGQGDFESVDGGFWVKEDIKVLSLLEYKDYRYNEIDERTGGLISLGFGFDSMQFSLSVNARDNWNVIHNNKTLFTFPLDISTIDSNTYSLNEVDVETFWVTGLGIIKAHYDSGRAIKKLVFDATTEQEVQNIIDNR